MSDAMVSDMIPVTIITGFLGAGKTTLLNLILKEKGNKGIAVIENEFGAVSIDRELVAANLIEKEDIVSLSKGCVCCSLRKDIVRALAELERNSSNRKNKVDTVILETTGLADPGPVAFTFYSNPWIAARYKLDGIICVVDAQHMRQHIYDEKPGGPVNEVMQQIAFADLIVLNKVDLVSQAVSQEILKIIKHVNKTANVIECQLNSEGFRPPLEKLLGTNLFSLNRALQVDPNFLEDVSSADEEPSSPTRDEAPAKTVPVPNEPAIVEHGMHTSKRRLTDGQADDDCGNQQGESKISLKRRRRHLHDLSGVSSIGIVAQGSLDEYRFNMFMRDLLTEKSKDIFRCKGVLSIHGCGNTKFVFQGVHETICYGPSEKPWCEGEQRISQIVFIGRSLDRKAITESFRTCVWVPLPDGWTEHRDKRTSQPYYVSRITGEKTWSRPITAVARLEVLPLSLGHQAPCSSNSKIAGRLSATSHDTPPPQAVLTH